MLEKNSESQVHVEEIEEPPPPGQVSPSGWSASG